MAVHFQEDQQLDPRLMTKAYAIAARGAGAKLHEYMPVDGGEPLVITGYQIVSS